MGEEGWKVDEIQPNKIEYEREEMNQIIRHLCGLLDIFISPLFINQTDVYDEYFNSKNTIAKWSMRFSFFVLKSFTVFARENSRQCDMGALFLFDQINRNGKRKWRGFGL